MASNFCVYALWHLQSEGRASNVVSGRTREVWLHIIHISYHVLLVLLVTTPLSYVKLGNIHVLHALLTPKWYPNPASSHSCPHDLSVRYFWIPLGHRVSSMSM